MPFLNTSHSDFPFYLFQLQIWIHILTFPCSCFGRYGIIHLRDFLSVFKKLVEISFHWLFDISRLTFLDLKIMERVTVNFVPNYLQIYTVQWCRILTNIKFKMLVLNFTWIESWFSMNVDITILIRWKKWRRRRATKNILF